MATDDGHHPAATARRDQHPDRHRHAHAHDRAHPDARQGTAMSHRFVKNAPDLDVCTVCLLRERDHHSSSGAADLLALLDQLDAAREKATPGEWREGAAHPYVYAESPGCPVVADCYGPANLALIVAAVNALPILTAALRAVAELAEELQRESDADRDSAEDFDRGASWGHDDAAVRIRAVLAPTEPES
jgi:hypothetical protein